MGWVVETAMNIGGRREQQDRVIALRSRWRHESMIALADGMGGHQQGSAAAQTVVDTVRDLFAEGQRRENPRKLLDHMCREAHRRICALARPDSEARPGSTCVLLYLRRDEAYWLHLGDSRLYHFRGAQLLGQTRDHSLVQLLRDQGQVESEPDPISSNQIYACLGLQAEPVLDSDACAVTAEDWFLLCSDGFWSMVSVDEVVEIVGQTSRKAPPVALYLTSLAAKRGGSAGDNVSLAVVRHRSKPSFA